MTAESLRRYIRTQGYDFDNLKNFEDLDRVIDNVNDFLTSDGNNKQRSLKQINQVKKAVRAIRDIDVIDEIQQRNQDYLVVKKREISQATTIEELPSIDTEYNTNVVKSLNLIRGNKLSTLQRLTELRRGFIEDVTFEQLQRSKFRTVSSLANFYNVSNEEAITKLTELGLEVEDNRILRS